MKVQVMMSDEMVAKVDNYARAMGVSRSALCSMLIGQGIMNYDKAYSIATTLADKYGQGFVDGATGEDARGPQA